MTDCRVLERNRFFEANVDLVRSIRAGQTVSFLHQVDATRLARLREDLFAWSGQRPSWTSLLVKAVSLVLRDHPGMNRKAFTLPFFSRLVQFEKISASVAAELSIPGAPMLAWVTTIERSDSLPLAEINRHLQTVSSQDPEQNPRLSLFLKLIRRMPPLLRRWILRLPELIPSLWARHRGGAFLVSSPAKYGVDTVVGSWPWPLAFSFGLIKKRPAVVSDRVVVRLTMPLSMNFDRRVAAGGPAARFFHDIVGRLENADLGEEVPSRAQSQSRFECHELAEASHG